ncbi:hypothetical protein G6514_003279 [Epicoccum nigrum]|nr:hypothetical protein G6514_003279 [Epicoccum nigrum]
MSDYGDDYSDYGEDWFYVEEEFIAADDLAEHAVASPPPTTYADEDAAEDWDRFDYFNDLEYASDGYDDAVFQTHDTKGAKIGEKRKRHVKPSQSKKRQRVTGDTEAAAKGMSPIVWRSQASRGLQPKLLDENAETYTVLQDWRKKLKDTPQWARGSVPQSPTAQAVNEQQHIAEIAVTAESASPPSGLDQEDDGALEDEMDIDPGALMAALQTRLAEAGGPLSGMDPQQLLDFAMRMATGKDAGDDIAGEMADAMLNQCEEGEEEDPEAEANLLSWVSQQRSGGTDSSANAPSSATTNDISTVTSETTTSVTHSLHTNNFDIALAPRTLNSTRGSELSNLDKFPGQGSPSAYDGSDPVNTDASHRNVKTNQTATRNRTQKSASTKRKASSDDEETGISTKPAKKRATRTFDAPTAASQARTASSRTTRASRKK